MQEHLIADLALGLIWFAAGFICGADLVMAKARRMVRAMRTVRDAPQPIRSDWCFRCRRDLSASEAFLLGTDNRIREFAFGLPGDKVLCRDCSTLPWRPINRRGQKVFNDDSPGHCKAVPDPEAQEKAA